MTTWMLQSPECLPESCPAACSDASIMLAFTMPTLTIRNVSPRIVQSLNSLARRHGRSMEQEVREVIEEHVAEREAILEQIEASWGEQRRRPTAAEVDRWLETGR